MIANNLLIELGTEELPPKSLRKLAESLHDDFIKQLNELSLEFNYSKWYATPRRLALYINALASRQQDRIFEAKGPNVKAAFDESGKPTKAALAWAASNGISLDKAERLRTPKGEWLFCKTVRKGSDTAALIPNLFQNSLKALPIAKLMHWGAKHVEFVRPVHSLCVLYGEQLIECEILGIKSSRVVNGHRFLGSSQLTIKNADTYLEQLRVEGNVLADYDVRKSSIIAQVNEIAEKVHGHADLDDDLVEEVTSIVEAPYIYCAKFEERFLSVPSEALVHTMKTDQKYFPIYDKDNRLLPVFAFVSNIHPVNSAALISGNERVIRPRLADAEFFFKSDRMHRLEEYYDRLKTIVYHRDIGTIAERTEIVRQLASFIATKINAEPDLADRAAFLAKCDLATTMVTEFTEIQGIIGMHYAKLDGENENVAEAVFQQYCPRFAGDLIPSKPVQISLSLAEKITTLVSIFGINLLPKGDKDPFGLRRAAIGLIRIIIENKIDIDIVELVNYTIARLSTKVSNKNTSAAVIDFIFNRLKAYYQDQGIETAIFLSVLSSKNGSLLDFDCRIKAVKKFKQMPQAKNLAGAYKRICNILKNVELPSTSVDSTLLADGAELNLFRHIEAITPRISEYYINGNYEDAMTALSELKDDVDCFFESVLVNAEDMSIRQNRLAILLTLSNLMSKTADISVLY